MTGQSCSKDCRDKSGNDKNLLRLAMNSKSRHLGYLAFFSIFFLCFFSCSLDYGTENKQEKRIVPEMILSDAKFTRVEKLVETSNFEASSLEVFNLDDTIYGKDIHFKSFENNRLTASGDSEFIKIDNRNSTYLLLGKSNIYGIKNGINIYADNLKWNNRTNQLTSDIDSIVTIYKSPDKNNDASLTITGSGFALSALSLNYVFKGKVNSVIETKN